MAVWEPGTRSPSKGDLGDYAKSRSWQDATWAWTRKRAQKHAYLAPFISVSAHMARHLPHDESLTQTFTDDSLTDAKHYARRLVDEHGAVSATVRGYVYIPWAENHRGRFYGWFDFGTYEADDYAERE